MLLMQCLALWQLCEAAAHVQFGAWMTRQFGPTGDHCLSEDGPNIATVGRPSAAAMCIGPVSLEITAPADFNTPSSRVRSSAGNTLASGDSGWSF